MARNQLKIYGTNLRLSDISHLTFSHFENHVRARFRMGNRCTGWHFHFATRDIFDVSIPTKVRKKLCIEARGTLVVKILICSARPLSLNRPFAPAPKNGSNRARTVDRAYVCVARTRARETVFVSRSELNLRSVSAG